MPRHAGRNTGSFEERCLAEADKLEREALALPSGPTRDELLRRSRQAKIAAGLEDWLISPGLSLPV